MAIVDGTRAAYTSDTNKWLNTQRATGTPEMADNSSTLPITSTNIEIWCNGMIIGFVQSFQPSEQRQIQKVQELGTEGVVQSVPGNTNGGEISLTRLAIFNADLYNALGLTPTGKFAQYSDHIYNSTTVYNETYNTLGNPFRTLKEQRVPLELQTKIKQPDLSEKKYYVTTYCDAWLSQYSRTITSQAITVTETARLKYCSVYTTIASAE